MTIRILLADDEPLMRAGLALLLDGEVDFAVVGEAGDGIDAVGLARTLRADLVLMDVRMPHLDGVAATRTITAEGLARVLVLTTYHADDAVYAALRAGAAGFLLKDAAPADLTAAVRAVVAGGSWLHPAVAGRLIADIVARPAPGAIHAAEIDRLTPREREVLVLIAYGLSNPEIAAHLVLGEATVKTHVGRILMKLQVPDRANAVVVAYQRGLVTPGNSRSVPAL
jgi:DNA-binding NarL/FixJ family response regulator